MTAKQITNRQAKILATLKAGRYGGWGGDSEFLSYSWERFLNWCSGQILEGLGSGEFRGSLHSALCWAMAWNEYQGLKRQLESKYGLDKQTNS